MNVSAYFRGWAINSRPESGQSCLDLERGSCDVSQCEYGIIIGSLCDQCLSDKTCGGLAFCYSGFCSVLSVSN